jgi:hypothetical protein
MNSRICLLLAAALLAAGCGDRYVVGYDYRVASRDPKITSAQILGVVTRSLNPPEASASSSATAWAKVDEKTGEVIFTLGAFGEGKTTSIRNTEARLLRDLRYGFGDRVELFCNGERVRADGTVEPRPSSTTPPPAQGEAGSGP